LDVADCSALAAADECAPARRRIPGAYPRGDNLTAFAPRTRGLVLRFGTGGLDDAFVSGR